MRFERFPRWGIDPPKRLYAEQATEKSPMTTMQVDHCFSGRGFQNHIRDRVTAGIRKKYLLH
jgi:hypothetical protein